MESQISRAELYRLVWDEPLSKLAGRFGLSDNGLRLRCERYDIPLPPRGYRQEIAAGRKPLRQPLPNSADGDRIVLTVPDQGRPGTLAAAGPFPELLANEAKLPAPDIVRDDDDQHPVALMVREGLWTVRPDSRGGLIYAGSSFRVRVYPHSVDRACRLVGAIFRAAERRSFVSQDGMHRLEIGGTPSASFGIKELATERRFNGPGAMPAWVPTGKFTVQVPIPPSGYEQASINDGRRALVEEQIGKVMQYLIKTAQRTAEAVASMQALKDRAEIENRRRRELRRARETETTFLNNLERDAGLWARAMSIRVFADAIAHSGDAERASLALVWADRLDPLVSTPPSVLDLSDQDVADLPWWWDAIQPRA